jgi:hypothetical protein
LFSKGSHYEQYKGQKDQLHNSTENIKPLAADKYRYIDNSRKNIEQKISKPQNLKMN